MTTPREAFIKAAFAMSKATLPELWDRFMGAFDDYARSEFERGLNSQTQDVLISVGMNRRLKELRDDFKNLDEIYKKITKNE